MIDPDSTFLHTSHLEEIFFVMSLPEDVKNCSVDEGDCGKVSWPGRTRVLEFLVEAMNKKTS